jgi:two-component system, NtrC family, response regulator AtoC
MTDSSVWTPRIVRHVAPDDPASLFAQIHELARQNTVAIVAAPHGSEVRGAELAAALENHVVVVAACDDVDHAITRARELIHTDRGVGVAVSPFDGVDPCALVESACAACDRAAPGGIARAEDVVEYVALGARVAVVADASTARVYDLARRLAGVTIPVTIYGPTGTGKDLVAAALHRFSPRANQPFVALNCAAIPDSLAEAELFGHAKGAFTGAIASRAGVIEASSGGTLFLDEVAELSPGTQARLLRVLESGELQRIGETTPRPLDLHVVAATHRDLTAEVAAGRFRKDLSYRLGVARVDLAPLCERPRDLAALVRRFTSEACAQAGRPAMRLAPATLRALFSYDWPGNIRELRHAIEFAVATAAVDDNADILPSHLPSARADRSRARSLRDDRPRPQMRLVGAQSIEAELQALERQRMVEALALSHGVQKQAAALIQMPLRSFVTKLKRYNITERDWLEAGSA